MPEQSVPHQDTESDQQTTYQILEGDTYENRWYAGYPRRDHRIIRSFAGCIQKEDID